MSWRGETFTHRLQPPVPAAVAAKPEASAGRPRLQPTNRVPLARIRPVCSPAG